MWLIKLDSSGWCPVSPWDVEWHKRDSDYEDGWVEYVHMKELEESIHFNAYGECRVVLKSDGLSPREAVRKAQAWREKVLDRLVRRGREQQAGVTSQTVWQEGQAQDVLRWAQTCPSPGDEGGGDV